MAQILVTGATGFIGRHLVPYLLARGHRVVEAGRRLRSAEARFVAIGDIGPETDWERALAGVEAVVHLAGLAHRGNAGEADYLTVNDAGTRRLADACAAGGVDTIVLVSSIAAREAAAAPGHASVYGRSKLAGEAHVRQFAEAGGTGIVLRPPLVYGHDAPGNWEWLQRLAAGGLPLPLGRATNRRSLCSVGNLCHAITKAVETGVREARSGTYEIADRETLPLAEIIALLRSGMDVPRRLLPVPPRLLRLAAQAVGRAALTEDLTLDASGFMQIFGWSPPESAPDAIMRSGRLYISAR